MQLPTILPRLDLDGYSPPLRDAPFAWSLRAEYEVPVMIKLDVFGGLQLQRALVQQSPDLPGRSQLYLLR